MTDSNTVNGTIDTDRSRNMAAFDALPPMLRDALRECSQDYGCEPILRAWEWGACEHDIRRHLRRRDEHARRVEVSEWEAKQ